MQGEDINKLRKEFDPPVAVEMGVAMIKHNGAPIELIEFNTKK